MSHKSGKSKLPKDNFKCHLRTAIEAGDLLVPQLTGNSEGFEEAIKRIMDIFVYGLIDIQ